MSQPNVQHAHNKNNGSNPDPKALKILAKSIFKELKSQGYDNKQVVGLATELISLVTDDMQGQ